MDRKEWRFNTNNQQNGRKDMERSKTNKRNSKNDHVQDETKRVGGKASGSSKTVVDKRVEVMPGIDG